MLFWEHLIYVHNVCTFLTVQKLRIQIANYKSFPMFTVFMLITANICYSEHAPGF